MKKISLFMVVFFLALFSFFIIGCSDNNNPTDNEKENVLKEIKVSSTGKMDYFVGDEFDPTGFVLELSFSNEVKNIDLDKSMCSITKFLESGTISITISYEGISTAINVNVKEKEVEDKIEKIEVKNQGVNIYNSEMTLDLKDYIFTLTFTSGRALDISGNDSKISASKTTFVESEDSYEDEITISYDGLVSVIIKVQVLSEWDYEDYLEEKEMEELLAKLDEDLESSIPEEATTDINLPQTKDYNYKLKMLWDSDYSGVISASGKVNRREEDVTVTLSLDVSKPGSSTTLKHYEYKVKVPGLGPVEFEDLTNKKIVMAYFYEGTFREMSKSDGNKIDIMCYCFGRVNNGELSISGLGHLSTIMTWRREYKMRVLLSIGGGASGGFSGAVKDDASRKVFVDSIMKVIKEYGFDGIDMDWEYPGWSGLADSTPYDVQNFSYLLRDLRAAMDEYKSGLLLTAAVISSSADKFYQPKELNKYLDYVNIMTYDGNNSGLATHHTKPFGSGYSAKNAIELWTKAGVDARKIVVGAAFYGKISELQTPVSNPEDSLGKTTISTTTITYTKIYNEYLNNSSFRECYDPQTGAYYLSDGRYFITYDNFYSIKSKAELVRDYGLAGMMFWDFGSDSTGQLLSAVYSGINALNK